MPRPRSGSKADSTVINQVINVDGVFRKPEPRGRSTNPDADYQNLENKVDDLTKDRRREERLRLRQDLHDFVDANPHGWSGKQSKPAIAAVRDKVTDRTYFNHNVNSVNADDLDPILRERYDRFLQDGFKDLEGAGAPKHTPPGTHAEARAMNEALRDARAEGREPNLADFMIETTKIMRPGHVAHKSPMPCCQNCAQFLDGADGAWNGWGEPFKAGSKADKWDGTYPD